ncbi:MAG: ATP-binding protein [Bacteroidota bacterium]
MKALELPYQRRSELSSRDAATVIGNYGLNQSKLDEPQALENLDLAMKLRLQENDLQGLFSSYKDLANYFLDREDRVTANDYANRAIVVADSLENPVYRKTALLLKLKLDQNLEAIEYGALVDSLDRVKQQSRNAYAGLKYNLDLEEQRTKANEIRAIKEKSKRIAFQATAIVILVVAVSLILMIRMRHKKEKVREVFLTESRISKKVHDEVANDLYQVMTKLQSSSNSKDELLDDLDGIYAKTRDISKEHGLVDVEINFNEQLDDLFRSYETAEISIVTQNNAKVDWNEISELKKKTIYKVLQELLTNMRKHSKASHVLMRFDQMNRRISIHYKDNGIGCNLKKSNGLQNVENRMEALHGRITFESEPNKGFEAKMQV